LNEKLEWREQRDYTIHQVKDIKTKCIKYPKRRLWVGATKGVREVEKIMQHIQSLNYSDTPDYHEFIRELLSIYNNYEMVNVPGSSTQPNWQLVCRRQPLYSDLTTLERELN
jgi:hypothetical protein